MFEIKDENDVIILWKNSEESEEDLINQLKQRTNEIENPHFGSGWTNVKIILLKNLKENVNFEKTQKVDYTELKNISTLIKT